MATVDNLLADLQVRLPGSVAILVERELALTVLDLRAEALGLPPFDPSTASSTWLTDEAYVANYLVLLHGTMARMMAEPDKPYSNIELAGAHGTIYSDLLTKAKGTANADPSSGIERVLNSARAVLPGTRDEVLELELVAAIDEFLNETNAWYEEIEFTTVVTSPATKTYAVAPTAGRITRLMALANADEFSVAGDMPTPGTVRLSNSPSEVQTLTATLALSIQADDTIATIDIPAWILEKYYVALNHGLLGRMQMQPSKPYSSERAAIFNQRKFRSLKAVARSEAQQAFKFRQQPWKFPGGWA